MLIIYGEACGNASKSRRLYEERFPDRKRPSAQVFVNTIFRLRAKGTLLPDYEGRGCKKSMKVLCAEEKLKDIMDDNPRLSTRQAAKLIGISQSTASRLLRSKSPLSYQVQVMQLSESDQIARVNFCTWFRQKRIEEQNLAKRILFADECRFSRNGILKFRNVYSSSEDIISVNVWVGIVGDTLLGPCILPAKLTQDSYLRFLRNTMQKYLDDIPLYAQGNLWFMHDGEGSHISQEVCDFFNKTFSQWIGGGDHGSWSTRSPDLNPIDFFFWDYMERLVYDCKNVIKTEEDLCQYILKAAKHIEKQSGNFQWMRESLSRRVEACIYAKGANFDHLL
ncbi:hypothetical protein Trydic_g159 [Trypoxylus dichotomus]